MKRMKILSVFLIASVFTFLLFCSCTKQEEKDTTTTVYGTVVDAQTGAALSAVQVSFGEGHIMGSLYGWEAFASAVTGMDGHFEMTFPQTVMSDPVYTGIIRAEKSGYKSYCEKRDVTLGQGNKYQMDILLSRAK